MTKQEWVSSHEAVAKLRAAGGDDPRSLVSWAAFGSLKTRYASMMLNGREDKFCEAPNIPASFWIQLRSDSRAQFDWTAGVFSGRVSHITSGLPEHADLVCSGVEFNLRDLQTCLTTLGSRTGISQKNLRNAGVLPRKEGWERVAAAMAVLAKKGQLDPSNSDNKLHADIEVLIADMCEADCFCVDNLRGTLKLYREWLGKHDLPDDD